MPDFSAMRRPKLATRQDAAPREAEKPKPKVLPALRHRLRAEVLAEKR